MWRMWKNVNNEKEVFFGELLTAVKQLIRTMFCKSSARGVNNNNNSHLAHYYDDVLI